MQGKAFFHKLRTIRREVLAFGDALNEVAAAKVRWGAT
jgi:hypothetical protein